MACNTTSVCLFICSIVYLLYQLNYFEICLVSIIFWHIDQERIWFTPKNHVLESHIDITLVTRSKALITKPHTWTMLSTKKLTMYVLETAKGHSYSRFVFWACEYNVRTSQVCDICFYQICRRLQLVPTYVSFTMTD